MQPDLQKEKEYIALIFQIGKNTYNLSFHQDAPVEELKESFIYK